MLTRTYVLASALLDFLSLGLAGHSRDWRRRFQSVSVVAGISDLACLRLLTGLDVDNPFIVQNFVEGRATVHGYLEHTPNDIATFARENPQQPPRALDHLLTLAVRLRITGKRRRLLARGPRGFFVGTIATRGFLLGVLRDMVVMYGSGIGFRLLFLFGGLIR